MTVKATNKSNLRPIPHLDIPLARWRQRLLLAACTLIILELSNTRYEVDLICRDKFCLVAHLVVKVDGAEDDLCNERKAILDVRILEGSLGENR